MIAHVYKPRRHKDGKLVVSRLYRARIRLQGDSSVTEVPLETSDRQVAEKKLAELISERERERAGLIAPRLQRDSAQRPILEHLDEFLADLTVLRRSEDYRKHIQWRVTRVVQDQGWRFPSEISSNAFVSWRTRQTELGPKTLNEYLNSLNTFLNWMKKQGRIAANPLLDTSKVDTRGTQQRRRAFTDEEFDRLLSVATPDMRLLYQAAAFTGLRIGELRAIVWGDLKLDDSRPHIVVRAATTKNRRQAVVPLHPQLVEELRACRTAETLPSQRVFSQLTQPHRRIRNDMRTAGIDRMDATGRKLDFHALRYTFATKLAQSGVSLRLAQELLRHSDPRLTANIYTDASQLPAFSAVTNLSWSSRPRGSGEASAPKEDTQEYTQGAPQGIDADGHNRASSVCLGDKAVALETAENQRAGPVLSSKDPVCLPLEPRGFECRFEKPQNRSSSGIAGSGSGGFARVAPQQSGIVCSVLSRVVRNWQRVPDSIRNAIGAIIDPYVSEVSCGDFLGRLGVMPLLKFLTAPANEGRAS